MSSIFCLFSIDNNYDQPDNNLVAWWPKRPNIAQVAAVLELDIKPITLSETADNYYEISRIAETIVAITKILQGRDVSLMGSDYRLQETQPGIKIVKP
jgi:hypothetical protein